MMNLVKRLSFYCLPAILCGFSVSCQKVQNASAEKPAAVGDNGQALVDNPNGAPGSLEMATNNTPTAPAAQDSGRNRFGFSGSDTSDTPIKPLRRDTQTYPVEDKPKIKDRISNIGSDLKDVANTPLKRAEEKKISPPDVPVPPAPPAAPKPPTVSPIVKVGFADSIPGDPLHVTLPGEYVSLGSVSVERRDPAGNRLGSAWARGTQMQIPNPRVPGGTIYFKVP